MEVGKKLRGLREDKKMSMYRLTQLTGVSGHHIKGIEEGTRQPTIETLNRLAVALGSSHAEMFNDDTECTYLTEKERHLIEKFRRLSDEKADALLNMSYVLNKSAMATVKDAVAVFFYPYWTYKSSVKYLENRLSNH